MRRTLLALATMALMNKAALSRWLPFLAWPRPSGSLLAGELTAGATVGLMLVPQGIAYAALAGMPLVTGIYASLLPALVAVLWSSSTRLGVGPTALTSLLVGASLTGLAEPGSAQWVAMAAWLAILSGALQLAMGGMRLGWVMQVVTSPVLSGFTQAAAILILFSQLPALLGAKGSMLEVLRFASHASIDVMGAAFGLGSWALLWFTKRRWPRFPSVVVIMGGAAALSVALGYADKGGAVVGAVPAGLPHLVWPGALSWLVASDLVMPVLVITLVSFLETASSAKVDHRQGGTRWNENQDLIAHGMAKISAGLSGAFPTSASFSRSAINLYAGAKSGWATLFATVIVLVALLWLTPALYHVPKSVLAAVVVAAIVGLLQPRLAGQLWRVSRPEALIGVATFALTLVTAPRLYWGVLAGVLLNLMHFLYQRLHPRIIEVGEHPDGSLRDRHLWTLPLLAPEVLALRMDAELDFASARSIEQTLATRLQDDPGIRDVCLFAQPINRIDITGVETLARLTTLVWDRGAKLHISGLKLPVEQALVRAGVLPSPNVQTYRTEHQALEALRQLHAERAKSDKSDESGEPQR